jgi:predicted lactoylglutathione lyase
MTRQVYINLAVRDLATTVAFWKGLGFEFDAKFTDDNAACMVLNDSASVMLLSEPVFRGFTKHEPCDTEKATEALLAISASSRPGVDALVKRAVETGGRQAMPPRHHGFWYGWSFYDPDGHHWEVIAMDPVAAR